MSSTITIIALMTGATIVSVLAQPSMITCPTQTFSGQGLYCIGTALFQCDYPAAQAVLVDPCPQEKHTCQNRRAHGGRNDACVPMQLHASSSSAPTITSEEYISPVAWDSFFTEHSNEIELLPGLGPIHWEVSTNSTDAATYFDQCLALLFGFNHETAIRSCQQALVYDPQLAIAAWGIAYAYGPNINLDFDVDRANFANEYLADAVALMQANQLTGTISEKEQALIESLRVRYTDDTSYFPFGATPRYPFDLAYFDRMKEIMSTYPDDMHVATFTAEASLTIKPWKAWNYLGRPTLQTSAVSSPGFAQINEGKQILEAVLEQDPNHIGALHYYIHAVEASSEPTQALRAALRLKAVAWGQAHLVHAASHIYARMGDWGSAIISGEDAIEQDQLTLARNGEQDLYYIAHGDHNLYFYISVNAYAGRQRQTLKSCGDLTQRLKSQVPPITAQEYLLPMEQNFLVRFDEWQQVLNYPSHPIEQKATRVFWHLNRAIAFIATDVLDAAQAELNQASALVVDKEQFPFIMDPTYVFQNNPVLDLIEIYTAVAEALLHEAKGEVDDAVSTLVLAVEQFDHLLYDEPPPFYYPVRETLGAILLRANRATEAKDVFEKDLLMFPNNGRSMFGLVESLKLLGDSYETELESYESAWRWADTVLSVETLG